MEGTKGGMEGRTKEEVKEGKGGGRGHPETTETAKPRTCRGGHGCSLWGSGLPDRVASDLGHVPEADSLRS